MFLIPLFIGLAIATTLYLTIGWWGFWVIFPWIGASISIGIYLRKILPKNRKKLGRRISILLIMPVLLIFVPVANNENFQLEGVMLMVFVGFFSKGFIHYAIAKLFGPLVWGRGFCGWACWTAAVLEWLPIKREGVIDERLKKLRYLTLSISILLPLLLVFLLNYDVRGDYINRAELGWMIVGNLVYYGLAIPMAFIFKDKRAFCKITCPVSLIMKVPARFSLIKIKPTGNECVMCGACSRACPMDIDVMSYISAGKSVSSTECILCGECALSCPNGAIG